MTKTALDVPREQNRAGLAHLKAFSQWRRLLLLLGGTGGAGMGIGLMILAGVGVGPLDALTAGSAGLLGISMGQFLVISSIVMVAVAWAMGTRSGLGTLISFFGIGVIIDFTVRLGAPLAQAGLGVRVGAWLVGALLLGAAAAALNSSGLGASAYDQFVKAFTRFGWSLHLSRLIVDGCALALALLIGWSLGASVALGMGTIALLIVIPLMIKTLLPPMLRFASAG